jgi:hypothetical protein
VIVIGLQVPTQEWLRASLARGPADSVLCTRRSRNDSTFYVTGVPSDESFGKNGRGVICTRSPSAEAVLHPRDPSSSSHSNSQEPVRIRGQVALGTSKPSGGVFSPPLDIKNS